VDEELGDSRSDEVADELEPVDDGFFK